MGRQESMAVLYEEKLSPILAKQRLPEILSQKISKSQELSKTEITEPALEPHTQTLSEPIIQSPAQSFTTADEPKSTADFSNSSLNPVLEAVIEIKHEASRANDGDDEIVAATRTEEDSSEQVHPALKQNQEFWNNLKILKDQLLLINEQLK